jgi:hypothetical protein
MFEPADTIRALLRPVDSGTAKSFDWSELVWHCGLSGLERRGMHDLIQHWLLIWLFCNGLWAVLPLEDDTHAAAD